MEYFSAKIVPLIIGGIVTFLAVIGLIREIIGKRASETTTSQDEAEDVAESGESWLRYGVLGAWLVGLFLAVYLVGFLVAIPLFILSYMKTHGAKWHVAIIFAGLVTVIVWVVFEVALKVYLYEGLLFS